MFSETVDSSKYVETRLIGRLPHIRGRRLPMTFVASAERATGLSVAELADEFSLSEEQVLAALLYYHEHRAELDAMDREETRFWAAHSAL
jgi:uncharacterized protein (DUF433 family)